MFATVNAGQRASFLSWKTWNASRTANLSVSVGREFKLIALNPAGINVTLIVLAFIGHTNVFQQVFYAIMDGHTNLLNGTSIANITDQFNTTNYSLHSLDVLKQGESRFAIVYGLFDNANKTTTIRHHLFRIQFPTGVLFVFVVCDTSCSSVGSPTTGPIVFSTSPIPSSANIEITNVTLVVSVCCGTSIAVAVCLS